MKCENSLAYTMSQWDGAHEASCRPLNIISGTPTFSRRSKIIWIPTSFEIIVYFFCHNRWGLKSLWPHWVWCPLNGAIHKMKLLISVWGATKEKERKRGKKNLRLIWNEILALLIQKIIKIQNLQTLNKKQNLVKAY